MKHVFLLLCLAAALYFGYKKINPTLPPDEVVNYDHNLLLVSNGMSSSNVRQPAFGKWHDSHYRQGDKWRSVVVPYQVRLMSFEVVRQAPRDWDQKGKTVRGYPVDITLKLERAYNMSQVEKADGFKDLLEKTIKDLPVTETVEKKLIYFREEDGKTWRFEPRKS
jgi:hypothetical protein